MVEKRNIALCIVFTVLSCGLYGWYWLYVSGEALEQYEVSRGGMGGGHLGILYLLLGIFGFGIISYALMQSELNKYAA